MIWILLYFIVAFLVEVTLVHYQYRTEGRVWNDSNRTTTDVLGSTCRALLWPIALMWVYQEWDYNRKKARS